MSIKERKDINPEDTWDLSALFTDDAAWEKALAELEEGIAKVSEYKGSLGDSAENVGDSQVQGLYSRYMGVATKLAAEGSWMEPEIQSIDDVLMEDFLKNDLLSPYRVHLSKLLRFKAHVLTEKEESLLAKQIESTQTPSKTFSALTDVDMDFGKVKTPEGEVTLSQSSYSSLLLNKDRSIREEAYRKFYSSFDSHKNTLANLYTGSVLRDKYLAEVRGYPSARAKALFPDKVPEDVYDNLVNSVRRNLPALHDYYKLRSERLGVKGNLRPWDVYASLVDVADVHHSWDEAVETVCDSLTPLGDEYVTTIHKGLSGRWADKYENKGKRSGAFSAGSYTGEPYILMNFKEDVLRDVFTLAHEGGHSMHSWYSVRNNPLPHYSYTIFEAEVASTFNEQLLAHKLIKESSDKAVKAYLVGKQIDDVIATIYRQTMFAEFERDTHAMAESGKPLTLDSLREVYRRLLSDYFGEAMNLEEVSDLEGLRIPHFYRAFYVYKYATGLSAAMALSTRVLEGGASERGDYLNFLKSGGSKFPIESLKLAGVDMSRPEPVDSALKRFASLVKEFRGLTGE